MKLGRIKNLSFPVKIGLFLILTAWLLIPIQVFLKQKEKVSSLASPPQVTGGTSEKETLVWIDYTNKEYGYSFSRPKFLHERNVQLDRGYLNFVVFGETPYSQAKGIAVGVRKNKLEDEVKRLKQELEGEFEVELLSELIIEIDGREAVRLEYEPKDKVNLESRAVVIVGDGERCISISTVPGQIDEIISSFKFL